MLIEKPKPTGETVHDYLAHKGEALDVFFAPSNVAVIGATENPGSVGKTILQNLIASPFGGTVFPVNPKRASVLGIKAYPRIKDVPAQVDLAVIVTPAPTVPSIVRECVQAGVKGAIVISAGFKETGPAGVELEKQVLAEARRGKMRIIGPNCLGAMSPVSGLNATFAAGMARPGHVAFISQSGALLTAILDWSLQQKVGFSAFVSVGSMVDVDWGDLIDYLGDDPHTKSIVMYMETIGDARSFMSAAREVALNKPIIVIKPGRTEAAAKAAASHTGSMTGSDDVLDAAFQRCGALRVERISDVFHIAEVLSKQPRPQGNRLTIVTNAGGPAVLAADTLQLRGGTLSTLSKETIKSLDQFLPPAWSRANPIDVLGDADAERYARTLEIAAQDKSTDGLLVILTPQAMTEPTRTAAVLKDVKNMPNKPVLASWMGGQSVQPGINALREAGIPDFAYPDTAVQTFMYMHHYAQNLRALYETPADIRLSEEEHRRAGEARNIIGAILKTGRTLLTEQESKLLLAAYGIPTVPTAVAATEAEATRQAEKIGYPVVLKLHSRTITHKSDVGGVQLDLKNAAAVRAAFKTIVGRLKSLGRLKDFGGVTVQPMVKTDGIELILGASIDPQFGPVLLFGAGGRFVEVLKDRALGLPPLTSTLAKRMIERTRIAPALQGVRGMAPVSAAALERLLVRFGDLLIENPRIKEIDINPLLASGEGLLALDARVVLHEAKIPDNALPRPVIRPYPRAYVTAHKMNGARYMIRPIRPQDEPAMVRFHQNLSDRSVYMRYFQALNLDQRMAHERLMRRCYIDYQREIALVAEITPKGAPPEIIAVGRIVKSRLHPEEAEFSVVVVDPYQRRGLGTEIMKRLLAVAREEGLKKLTAVILGDNQEMLRLAAKMGFKSGGSKDGVVRVENIL